MTSHWTDYGLERYRRVEDKMAEKEQKTFYVERKEAEAIIKYYMERDNSACSGTLRFQDGGIVKIQPYQGKIEVMCDCNKETINELEEIIKKK